MLKIAFVVVFSIEQHEAYTQLYQVIIRYFLVQYRNKGTLIILSLNFDAWFFTKPKYVTLRRIKLIYVFR